MGRKAHVALIIETSSVYGRRILRGVTRYVRSHQPWSIFLEQRDIATKLPAWLNDWQGDGILSRNTNRQSAKRLAHSRVPVVDLTDRRGDLGLPHIWSDDHAIGRLAAEHLLERGFRYFAFCGFSREHWSKRRLAGFAETAGRSGKMCGVYESSWQGPSLHPWEEEQRELADWLLPLPKPTGIMTCNDVRGRHILDACNRVNLSVPEEVAVIGVDNDELLCELCNPPLSSVIPNPECIGYNAAELLDRLMAGKGPTQHEQLIPPLGIVTRQSTDVAAIDDPEVAAAMKYIREHACNGTTVDDVLAHLSLSRSILERRFRKYTARSPQEMIRQAQLKRVQQLLVETELPLATISALAGYKHVEYMCVVFKREFGQTPGAYRRQSQV